VHQPPGDGLGQCRDAELLLRVLGVEHHRPPADPHDLRDVRSALPLRGPLQAIDFPRGQRRTRLPFRPLLLPQPGMQVQGDQMQRMLVPLDTALELGKAFCLRLIGSRNDPIVQVKGSMVPTARAITGSIRS
jgi:hypothetical protein